MWETLRTLFAAPQQPEKDWAGIDRECLSFARELVDQANHDIWVLKVADPFETSGDFIEFEMSGIGGDRAFEISTKYGIVEVAARSAMRSAYRSALKERATKPWRQ